VSRSPRAHSGFASFRLSILCVLSVFSALSCARNAQRGLVIGAAGGAVIGGVIGKVSGSTAKGAIIGAAVGGAAGAIIGDQMDRQAKEIKQNIPGATVERVGEGIQVTFASGLLYDFDSDVVKSTARENLRALAGSLDKYPDSDLLILGHTDSVGTDAYNKGLSVRRADAAAEYLVSQGVARSRIGTGGLGEEEPIASNADEAGRQRNRRVEVAIYASKKLQEQARQRAGG
jgi:outer membrane protein OmpA-like peptidoglycan-associated protein